MPNLFSALPVAILAWVFGSISGLTRTEIATVRPLAAAIAASSSSSPSDSTFTQRMPSSTASASSRSVLPTPENMIFSGGMPAARAQKLAPRDHVGAGAAPRQRSDHGLIGIRLHGVTDQRIDIGEGLRKDAIVPLERRGRVAIKR